MSARTRPPSTEQHLTIIVELDRLADTADRLRAAMPTDLIRDFCRIVLSRTMRLPPPTTTTEANLRIEYLRRECWRLAAAMPLPADPAALSHDLEVALCESARLRALATCGESIDTAASVYARHRVEVFAAKMAGQCSLIVPKPVAC